MVKKRGRGCTFEAVPASIRPILKLRQGARGLACFNRREAGVRARLARIMQTIDSYGPSQPRADKSRIPRACKRRGKIDKRSSTRTRAREAGVFPRQKADTGKGNSWGGARNRKDRETEALRQEHAEGILRAIAVAELKGMPLNRFWTVNYEWAGIDDSDAVAFIGRLLAQCARYARARGGVFAAVWVREIGATNGGHVHIALHFPAGWKLSGPKVRKWIKRAGGKYSARVSDMRPIGGRLDCYLNNPQHYWTNVEAMASYMVKGSASEVVAELGLVTVKAGGRVIGKRWGRTQNVSLSYMPVYV